MITTANDDRHVRFDTEDLLPPTKCDGGLIDPQCYCPGDCLGDENIARDCLCSNGSGCFCGCDPAFDVNQYRMQYIEEEVGCPQGKGWILIDDGTLDTVIMVMDGYYLSGDALIYADDEKDG